MQALARNFLCVADEVWFLDHSDTPGAKVFKEFVKSAGGQLSWGPTTKQGVYAMTPDGEFLAGHVARHDKAATLALMRDALKKWGEIAAKKGLKPKPIPPRAANRTWDAQQGLARNAGGDAGAKAGLILQVTVRDLPYRGERHPGAPEYRNWFNQTWIDFSDSETMSLLPKNGKSPVPDALVRKLARETMLDFVRGQTPAWSEGAVKKATLTVEPAPGKEGFVNVRYQGEFHLEEGGRAFEGRLHGKAMFDPRTGRFRNFELIAAGMRRGRTENFRGDAPPSPLGLAFIIEDQYDQRR